MKTKTGSGVDLLDDLLDEDLSTFNIIREGLEDLNLYLAEIEKLYDMLKSDNVENNDLMLTYKLSILENKLSELNTVLSDKISSCITDKSKLS
ncbi:MAG: hypothetical protein FXF49_06020 [Flexistipes sinusarabici]|uniref:Uncharacterized protein n=1 Tax=Flexistipes sinusarabici TaxID=2352 RepID=A0A5D0MIB6_FLESI|nr:hypothetical protein [Flexistipes sinusarabici]TYB33464.1 MAG: hypothetical protein FXF49_06020 [Flexistipes sinusarabici]